MPVASTAVSMRPTNPTLQAHARLVSLNGGVVLAVCILFTAFFLAAMVTTRLVGVQSALFGILMVGAWIYLLDSATERLALVGNALERSSSFGRRVRINLDGLDTLFLVHEGLNQEVGIESVVARMRDGREERLPLGPCWRKRDLEAFLASVEQVGA